MSTAVFAFGRFNPPTIGHEKLVNAVIAINQREGGTALIYGSHSQDNRKNPLSHIQKFKYLKKMFHPQTLYENLYLDVPLKIPIVVLCH